MKRALIVVDIQNDFLPGGALAVHRGDEVVPVANQLMQLKGDVFERVVATQDWHPPDHLSFAMHHPGKLPGDLVSLDGIPQVLWPAHCVQNQWGAEFASGLQTAFFDRIFRKGLNPRIDSYSGFFDQARLNSTGLAEYLREEKITDVSILGLATDFCVKFTALDALSQEFRTQIVEDGVRAVNLHPDDGKKSLSELKALGIDCVSMVQFFAF